MCQGLPEQGYSIRGEGRAVMKYVIIGNSAAGVGAVQGIRELDKDGDITMISDENYHTYSRPLISYWLKGDVTEEGMRSTVRSQRISLIPQSSTDASLLSNIFLHGRARVRSVA